MSSLPVHYRIIFLTFKIYLFDAHFSNKKANEPLCEIVLQYNEIPKDEVSTRKLSRYKVRLRELIVE